MWQGWDVESIVHDVGGWFGVGGSVYVDTRVNVFQDGDASTQTVSGEQSHGCATVSTTLNIHEAWDPSFD